jgi:energy-coupling factor transporter ATP-binding protein EcfA2
MLKDIMELWWTVREWISTDTNIDIWWILYRLNIAKDWDAIKITARRWPWPAEEPDYISNSFRLITKEIEKKQEEITLYDSYNKEDIINLINYAVEKRWLMIFAAPTGSWKSVSMRNLMNEVLKIKIEKEKQFVNIFELSDTIEDRNLNMVQLEMDWEDIATYWWLILKRSAPDYIIYWEIRDETFLWWAIDMAKTWSVMTTMHSFDVLAAIEQLKSWWDKINKSLTEIMSSVKIIISQMLYPYIKENYENIIEKELIANSKEEKEEILKKVIWYKKDFVQSLLNNWFSKDESNKLWNEFYSMFKDLNLIWIKDLKYFRPKLWYEIITQSQINKILKWDWTDLRIENMNYKEAVLNLYMPKETTILRSILIQKSPIIALESCSKSILPFAFLKMKEEWIIKKIYQFHWKEFN